MTVTPSTGLVDGQVVQIDGTGFDPNDQAGVIQCRSGATTLSECDFFTGTPFISTDANGEIHTTFTVSQVITVADVTVDCAVEACAIGVGTLDFVDTVTVDIGFEPTAAVPGPLDIELSAVELGFVDEATDVATVYLDVDCNRPAAVDASGSLRQLFPFGSISLVSESSFFEDERRSCGPDRPLRLTLEVPNAQSYGSGSLRGFTAGEATLSVDVFAEAGSDFPLDFDGETISVTVQLADREAFVTELREALADPANAALREEFRQQLRELADADPVFRQQLAEALRAAGHGDATAAAA